MMMNRRNFFRVGTLLSLGSMAALAQGPRKKAVRSYTVTAVGSSDASYRGVFRVDGVVQSVSGAGRKSWSFECQDLVCWFQRNLEGGLLHFEIRDSAGKLLTAAVPLPGGDCRLIARRGEAESRIYLRPVGRPPD